MILSDKIKKIHFIGVGGIGMCALAQWLLRENYIVQGSDQRCNNHCRRLIEQGMTFFEGHDVNVMADIDLVVYSSAIAESNCELNYARDKQIPCVKRGALLADIVSQYESIVIAGTHGKTTTTALTTHLLSASDYDPFAFIGGVVANQSGPLRVGSGRHFVVESDESDGSFLFLKPSIAIVTNIDRDHLNNYDNDFEKLKSAFVDFLNSVSPQGLAIVNIDDPIIKSILPRVHCRVVTSGFSLQADYLIEQYQQQGMMSQFNLTYPDKKTTALQLPIPGHHNVSNATAAMAVLDVLQSPMQNLPLALAHFAGVGRRFNCHGLIKLDHRQVYCVEDYGHHPKAIAMTIEAARLAWPDQRVILVFQPHRYSRTQDLFEHFIATINLADVVILLDVFAASEAQHQGVGSQALYSVLENRGMETYFISDHTLLRKTLAQVALDHDVVLFQGAGNVGELARSLVESSLRA